MKMAMIAAAAASVLTTGSALAESPPVSDATFVTKASVGNTFEREEAKLALDRATDPRIKSFAQKMMSDHHDAENKLQAAAGKAGDKVSATLDPPHQAMLDNLKTFVGTDFDKIYIADQIAAHVETVLLLSDDKQNGKNDDLMAWTKDAMPIVKMHRADVAAM